MNELSNDGSFPVFGLTWLCVLLQLLMHKVLWQPHI